MIEIVHLNAAHYKLLSRFFKEINTPDYIKDFSPHPFTTEHAEHICNYNGTDLYYAVLLEKERIVGYGMLRGWDEGYDVPSLGICILREHQSSSLGELLMLFLEVAARKRGCERIMLKVKSDNSTAISLYKKFGYIFEEYDKVFLVGLKDLICSEGKHGGVKN